MPVKITYLNEKVSWQDQDLGGKRPGKSVCITRYGGFGDAIQTASVLPELKKMGYHITLNVEGKTYETLKHNPYVDEFFIQKKDQVPNQELSHFWNKLSKCFSRYINFSESIEGSLLAIPGRIAYSWPPSARHAYMNHNYVEFMHKIAGVTYEKPYCKFHPDKNEKEWAKEERKKLGKKAFVIMWVLCGSSVHKATPYSDAVIAKLMLNHKQVKIVFVGDESCKILEYGWQNEKRVICKSGEWTIRETLSFAQTCDMIIGPETGVLNAMSMEEMPKVIYLSHSSIENLTRDWKNTVSLTPENVRCYPCHMLHYSTNTCDIKKDIGAAECVMAINDIKIYDAIEKFLIR